MPAHFLEREISAAAVHHALGDVIAYDDGGQQFASASALTRGRAKRRRDDHRARMCTAAEVIHFARMHRSTIHEHGQWQWKLFARTPEYGVACACTGRSHRLPDLDYFVGRGPGQRTAQRIEQYEVCKFAHVRWKIFVAQPGGIIRQARADRRAARGIHIQIHRMSRYGLSACMSSPMSGRVSSLCTSATTLSVFADR